jgi:transposase, IS6 family
MDNLDTSEPLLGFRPHIEHRKIKYRNNVIECDHGQLKRIIGATLGFKSMRTAYATIKGIEVMRALRKGQASPFYMVIP